MMTAERARRTREAFFRTVVRRPRAVLVLILTATAVLGWWATGVRLDSSIEALLPEGHAAVLQDREIKEEFESREMILVGVIRPEGILHPSTLGKIRDLSSAILDLSLAEARDAERLLRAARKAGSPWDSLATAIVSDGLGREDRARVANLLTAIERNDTDPGLLEAVREAHRLLEPVHRVISLTEVDDLTAAEGQLRVAPLVSDIPRGEEALGHLAHRIYGNEMYVRGLVAPDTTGTAILVEMSFHYDDAIPIAHRLFDRLDSLAGEYRGPEDIRLAGVPMVNIYTSKYMSGDMIRLMPVVGIVVFLVVLLAFRSGRMALLPLGVVLLSLTWVLGIMALLGRPITLVVSAMPVILVAVGVADGIHILSEFRDRWGQLGDRAQAVVASMQELAGPIALTSVTDMAGFGSLGISSLASIRDFGLFTSVGVLAALIVSLTALPAALVLLPPPRGRREGVRGSRVLERLLARVGAFAIGRRRWVVTAVVALAALGGLSLTRLQVGSTMVGYFHQDSEIYRASEMINRLFGGTEVLNVVVDTRRQDGLKDPEALRRIAVLQDALESDSLVGYTTSIADYVRRINYVLHDEQPTQDRLPGPVEQVLDTLRDATGRGAASVDTFTVSGRDVVAQYLLLYDNAGGDDLAPLADFGYRKANIIAQVRTDRTPELRRIKDAAQAFAQAQLGPEAEVTFAGCSYLCIVADELIIPSQLRSLAVAIGVVLLLLGLVFGSVRLGLIGLGPLLVTVVLVFGLMSVFGVYLDAATALIASIVLGVGIDYSVHFLSRYRTRRRLGETVEDAVRVTMITSGRAIVYNSLAVALGFSVLLLSSFWPVMHIGWLVAVNMVLGAALTLVLVPALLKATSRHAPATQAKGDHA